MLSCVFLIVTMTPFLVQAQYNQGQYDQGQYNPNQYNQGQYNPGQYQGQPSGQYSGGAPPQAADQPITATNYRTEDGQQRSESVDGQGNVRGQYSYVDPAGKTITVKYTAGKDGFQVEGDHLPKSPDVPSPAAAPQQQPQYNPQPQQQYNPQPQYNSQPQYNPQPQYNSQPQYNPQQGFQQQPQHRFGAPSQGGGGGLAVNQSPDGGFNYQFNYQ